MKVYRKKLKNHPNQILKAKNIKTKNPHDQHNDTWTVLKRHHSNQKQAKEKSLTKPKEEIKPTQEIVCNDTCEVYADPKSDVKDLLDELKIHPRNLNLYKEALTHSSYSNEQRTKISYQRLEFLGDAILNKLVACFLFNMSDDDEGQMTKDRISIIQAKTLVRASIDLNLGKYLKVGMGLIKRPISEKILEDIFEAFIGALYLDQDESRVNAILMQTIFKYYLNNDLQNTIDYKTKFQEAVQEHGKNKKILYKRVNNRNDANDFFEVDLIYNGMIYGRGRGLRLHDAEVSAAKRALEKISKVDLQKE